MLFKKLYNKLLEQVINLNGKIGNIFLKFGKEDNERYMVALSPLKVRLIL